VQEPINAADISMGQLFSFAALPNSSTGNALSGENGPFI